MKKKIVSCVLSLAMCLSIIAGGTYALFTSEAKTNIAITSGKVEVLATINADSLELYSPSIINKDGTVPDEATNAATKTNFANGGTATFSDNKYLTLSDITPGDNATFDIKIENNSTVAIQYQTVIATVGDNADLLGGLEISVTTGEKTESFTGTAIKTAWTKVEANAEFDPDTITVEVKLPASAGNDWQELSAELAFTIFAVQANTDTEDKPMIFNANQELNLDAIGIIEANGSNGVIQVVNGATVTVVGNGTVNAEMAEDNYAMAVWANGGNVVIEGGNYVQSGTGNDASYDMIYASNGGNITITGGTFKSATPAWTLNVKDADRETSHITVMGGRFYQFDPSNAQTGEGEISVPDGFAVVKDGDWYEVVDERIHIKNLADLKAFRDDVNAGNNYAGKIVVLDNDIDLANEAWTPIGGRAAANKILGTTGNQTNKAFSGIFDGQGHTISNLNITYTNTTYSAENCEVGLFGNIHAVGGEVDDGTIRAGIKNLTINNAKVNGSENVGVIVGTITGQEKNTNGANTHHGIIMQNFKVTGHVEVNGDHDVGTIAGHANGLRIFDENNNQLYGAENLVVDVDDTSYIKASVTMDDKWAKPQNGTRVGGVIGNLGYAGNHMTGGFKLKDISSNIDVTGANSAVGGLFGWIGENPTLENVSCSGNVTLNEAGTDFVKNGSATIAKWNTAGGICGRRCDQLTVTGYNFTGTVTITDVDDNTLTHTNALWDTFGASIQADGENTGANAVLNVTE